MDKNVENVLSIMTDVSSLLVSLAEKNLELTGVFAQSITEGRLPTKEEHEQVRKGFSDQLEILKETHAKMVNNA